MFSFTERVVRKIWKLGSLFWNGRNYKFNKCHFEFLNESDPNFLEESEIDFADFWGLHRTYEYNFGQAEIGTNKIILKDVHSGVQPRDSSSAQLNKLTTLQK